MKTNRDRRHSSTMKSNNRSCKKMKKTVQPRRFDGIDFSLKLKKVILRNPPNLSEQLYQILWRFNPGGREHESEVVKGDPNPEWNEECTIDLKGKPVNADLFLNVEVITYNSVENRRDPGTSNGIGEVLRGRIPFLKELNHKVGGAYELVKSDGTGVKVAGHIFLSMKLETYVWKKIGDRFDRKQERQKLDWCRKYLKASDTYR